MPQFAGACGVFALGVPPSEVLVRAAVAPFARGHPVAVGPEVLLHLLAVEHQAFFVSSGDHAAILIAPSCFVKVLLGVCSRHRRRSVEVVKHQVHIFLLLSVQVVSDFDVTVDLNLDVSVGLPRVSPGLRKVAVGVQLVGVSRAQALPVPLNALHLPRC